VTGAAGLTELVVGVMVSGHHCMLPGPWWEFLSERNRRVQPEELGVEEEVRRRCAALCSVRNRQAVGPTDLRRWEGKRRVALQESGGRVSEKGEGRSKREELSEALLMEARNFFERHLLLHLTGFSAERSWLTHPVDQTKGDESELSLRPSPRATRTDLEIIESLRETIRVLCVPPSSPPACQERAHDQSGGWPRAASGSRESSLRSCGSCSLL
jgi:hypothetical protein